MSHRKIRCALDKKICDAFGCVEEATVKVIVKAGGERIIYLNLCEKCKAKFQYPNT